MRLINKYQTSGKFSNTAVGRAMQALYNKEQPIAYTKELPEVFVNLSPELKFNLDLELARLAYPVNEQVIKHKFSDDPFMPDFNIPNDTTYTPVQSWFEIPILERGEQGLQNWNPEFDFTLMGGPLLMKWGLTKIGKGLYNAGRRSLSKLTSRGLLDLTDLILNAISRQGAKATPDPNIVKTFERIFLEAGIAPDDYLKAIDYILNFTPKTLEEANQFGSIVRSGYSIGQARPLFRRYIKQFKELGYTDKDILNELYLMGQKTRNITNMDAGLVSKFLEFDVAPRVLKLLNSEFKLTPAQQAEVLNLIKNLFNNITVTETYLPLWVGGSWNGSVMHIPIGRIISSDNLVHEAHHAYRTKLAELLKSWGYDISNSKNLSASQRAWDKVALKFLLNNPEYTPSELKTMTPFRFTNKQYFIDHGEIIVPTSELGATLSQVRFKTFEKLYNKLNRIPTLEEVDTAVKNLEFYNLMKDLHVNLYGKGFALGFEDEAFASSTKFTTDLVRGLRTNTRPKWVNPKDWSILLLTKNTRGLDKATQQMMGELILNQSSKHLLNPIRNGILTIGSVALPLGVGTYTQLELYNPQYDESY